MTFRRRQRWLRRLALVFAFATVLVAGRVAPAWAKYDAGSGTKTTDPYLTDVNVRQGESQGGPDGGQAAVHSIQGPAVARPDDRADRFTPSDVPVQAGQTSKSSTLEWSTVLTFGIGALVLALALGLAFAYVRRPKLAL
ncbi:MAG: hypothetical protein QOJ43_1389 [Gaiellaceae bacterium]|jgi:hypothetical protein|nr:hypothetical protein [Gaiellaceae bacterium]